MAISPQDIQEARNAIALAKKELESGHYDSAHSANYALRDLEATKVAGLSDLTWAMHRNNPHRNDVLGLIEHLEKFLANYPKRGKEVESDELPNQEG